MLISAFGLMACDDGASKDGSVFESDGQRVPATEPNAHPPPPRSADRVMLSEILLEPDAFVRAARLGTILPTLGPGPVSQLSAIFTDATLRLNIGGTEIELLTHYWAIHEPRAASTWAVEKAPRAYKRAVLFATFPIWAEAEPFAALEAAKGWVLEHADIRDDLPIALIQGWYAAGDPPELHAFIRSLGTTMNRQRAISAYVRAKLRGEGADPLMRWAEGVVEDDTKYKLGVYRQVSRALAPYDIDAALAWCLAHCDGPYGSTMRTMLARGWMQTDPAGSLAWVATQPLDQEYPTLMGDLAGSWLRRDRESAMDWLEEQVAKEPPPESLFSVYPSYAIAVAQDYGPAEAIPIAELIPDEAYRQKTVVMLAKEWLKRDRKACEAWLAQSDLPEEARDKVLGTMAGDS
jgi:hypothetical protein